MASCGINDEWWNHNICQLLVQGEYAIYTKGWGGGGSDVKRSGMLVALFTV